MYMHGSSSLGFHDADDGLLADRIRRPMANRALSSAAAQRT
jgi:hypothetical protein